jgi:DNA-directed RNA polymerase specialized sigma24 family protein
VEPPFPSEQFLPADDPVAPGHWATPPVAWEAIGARADDPDALEQARAAIAEMPEDMRQVILLRDVEGRTPDDVRNALGLSTEDEDTMLHQARGFVRARLEGYFKERVNDVRP